MPYGRTIVRYKRPGRAFSSGYNRFSRYGNRGVYSGVRRFGGYRRRYSGGYMKKACRKVVSKAMKYKLVNTVDPLIKKVVPKAGFVMFSLLLEGGKHRTRFYKTSQVDYLVNKYATKPFLLVESSGAQRTNT